MDRHRLDAEFGHPALDARREQTSVRERTVPLAVDDERADRVRVDDGKVGGAVHSCSIRVCDEPTVVDRAPVAS